MQLLKIGLVQSLLVGSVILASASPTFALELPDVHILSGETYPSVAQGSGTGTEIGILETEIGEKLTAENGVVTAELLELSSLGPLSMNIHGVKEPKTKTSCNTAGDPSGTVKLSGEYHVVDTSTSPLTAAVLTLFKELMVECNSGKLKVKIRSPLLGKLEKVTSGTDVTEFGIVEKCSGKGKQELKEYLNDEGKGTKAVLSANFGLGFETACVNVGSEQTMKVDKMVDFLF